MAAEPIYTWDIPAGSGGARRASLGDLGDAEIQEDATHPPPKDGHHLYADKLNQETMQTWGAGLMIPSVRFTLDFDAGAPFIDRISAPGTLIDADTFTLVDNGDGDTTVSWAAGDLPAIGCDPKAWMSGTGSWLAPVVEVVSPISIRVRTRNNSNTLTNGRVTVEIV